MKAVVQRVMQASVSVKEQKLAAIERGLLLLIGVAAGDSAEDSIYLARKISGLRVFEDPPGKMNLNVREIGGEILAIPQFTLLGDCRRGRRPDFTSAARPEAGKELFGHFCGELESQGIKVKRGAFGEHMLVGLENDGPVTLILDSQKKGEKDS